MLIIHPSDESSTYSQYLREILTVEGFSDLQYCPVEQVTTAHLKTHEVVFVVRMAVSDELRQRCLEYVSAGGNLVVFHPDDAFARVLGISTTRRIVLDAAIHITTPPHTSESIPLHIPAALWNVGDADVVATMQHGTVTAPAILKRRIGAGIVLAYAFELAQTIARTRHGDPALAGMSTGGLDGVLRPSELFVHQLDPQRSKVPVADLLTAHFALEIDALDPQPRIWYYPYAGQTSTLIMTSDDDWSSPADFRVMIDALDQYDAHCTFFLVPQSHITPGALPAWQQTGHSFSLHPAHSADADMGLLTDLPATDYAFMLGSAFERHNRVYGIPARTVRNHAVRWLGYVDAARLLASHGVRMDFNYLPVAPYFWSLCGSGRPMRFVDADGAVLDIYQQPTNWTEECLIHPEYVFSFKWNIALAIAVTDEYIDAAATHYYSPVTVNSHPVSFASYSRPLIEAHWKAAKRNHMPIISAQEWLGWTITREQIHLTWVGNELRMSGDAAIPHATILLPAGTTPSIPGQTVTRWGKTYKTVSLSLAEGESKVIATRG
jgi:peptidoglycan/xylan/chitin deacetylase (PgdA/CDA1 family)